MSKFVAAVGAGCVLAGAAATPAHAQAPRYDHVLIVVMEHHGLTQVGGNATAP